MKKKREARQTKIPQSYDELFPGRFLKGELFKGQAGTLTVKEVWRELMDEEEWAVIVSFKETPLHLTLNKTNGECLKGMFGKRIADWLGKRVTFYPRRVKAFGQQREAVRVLGSPDIPQDLPIQIDAGQASGERTMKKTEAKAWVRVAGDPEPPEDFGPGDDGPERGRGGGDPGA
jgi:hypothetical protein